jgi:hypothetical protein
MAQGPHPSVVVGAVRLVRLGVVHRPRPLEDRRGRLGGRYRARFFGCLSVLAGFPKDPAKEGGAGPLHGHCFEPWLQGWQKGKYVKNRKPGARLQAVKLPAPRCRQGTLGPHPLAEARRKATKKPRRKYRISGEASTRSLPKAFQEGATLKAYP